MYVCMYVCMRVYIYIYTYTHTYIQRERERYVCVCVCVYRYTCICVYIYIERERAREKESKRDTYAMYRETDNHRYLDARVAWMHGCTSTWTWRHAEALRRGRADTVNPRTKKLDFEWFDSSRFLT